MSLAQALADAGNRLAASIDNAVAQVANQTPDAAVTPVITQINAASDKLDAAFPKP